MTKSKIDAENIEKRHGSIQFFSRANSISFRNFFVST
ncbi:hypothetical protein LEP1GSC116_4640, partial [Leptospira interrogans serovar Icterohaemorrhagiae str. Verdun HP]